MHGNITATGLNCTCSLRLRRMIERCMQCWVLGLVSGYVHHLSAAKKTLERQLQKKQEDAEGAHPLFSL